jgi:nicotinate-nucleotide adenylyltransferase
MLNERPQVSHASIPLRQRQLRSCKLFTFYFFLAMRIGIFGGSFDPVHLGHLILAEQCREQGRLDQVWFVPAARPPHKAEAELTPFAQRVEMLQLAIAGNEAFRIQEVERDRPGPSYTAVTLAELQHHHESYEWFLLVGADSLRDLPGWYHPEQIVQLAELLVMARPGVALVPLEELKRQLGPGVRLQVVSVPLIEIASTEVRARLRQKRSVRYLIPRAVEAFISDKRLYQGG